MKMMKWLPIALLSTTLIALEIVWTRIFSAEFFYTFAFLILSLAIMGLGMGGLAVRLFPFLEKKNTLGIILALTGLMSMAGPPLVFQFDLNFSELFSKWNMVGKSLVTILILSSTYFLGGIALVLMFKKSHQDIDKLYMADLIGAGMGAVLSILLMNWIGTPAATFLIALPVLTAAWLTSQKGLKAIPALLVMGMVFLSTRAVSLLEVQREEPAKVIYKHWDAMAKVKMYGYDGTYRRINVDNVSNSPVYRFDGNWDMPDSAKFQFGIPVDYLIAQFDSCCFLSLGSGGGGDVLQALQEGAVEVHAVEVNPHINKMMTKGDPGGYSSSDTDTLTGEIMTLNDFSGNIYNDPRVTVVTEDARLYVKKFKNKFDVIYSLSSNTWAALASGSFALAENYLFTTEAFQDYWNALSEKGFMMMEHQFYMPRLVSEVRMALEKEGVADVTSHFAVYNLPQMRRNILLLSKRPLTDEIRYHAIYDLQPEYFKYIHLLYPAADSLKTLPIPQIVEKGWRTIQDSIAYDLSPTTDNRPFIAQMGLWKNYKKESLNRVLPYEFFGFPLTKMMIVILLLAVLVYLVPMNLIPYFKKGEKLRAAPWLYFFSIGWAFMTIEVVLIQKYTAFVGPSVYSIATILITLLVFSGIGSRFSRKMPDQIPFLAIVLWIILDILVLKSITSAASALPLGLRMGLSALLIAPLGFFMGMPFPKGVNRVGALVDWGFAVNGAASVLGSVLVILIAISYGFQVAMLFGAFIYLMALLLIRQQKAWS